MLGELPKLKLDATLRAISRCWPNTSLGSDVVRRLQFRAFEDFEKDERVFTDSVDDKTWTARERIVMDLAHTLDAVFTQQRWSRRMGELIPPRTLLLGNSSGRAHAWTDGLSKISIDRHYATNLPLTIGGFIDLYATLIHEYCHTVDDAATDTHGPEFYRLFHERIIRIGAEPYDRMVEASYDVMRRATGAKFRNQLKTQGTKLKHAADELRQAEFDFRELANKCASVTEGAGEDPVEVLAEADVPEEETEPSLFV